ncbi:hypothetical protein R1flu_002296 [Riccia fluitans]|uniref:Secreted protein n=1 Tax=Riccia fluitans TaxID=41844 RepID=A0ABD1Y5S9_9MARC
MMLMMWMLTAEYVFMAMHVVMYLARTLLPTEKSTYGSKDRTHRTSRKSHDSNHEKTALYTTWLWVDCAARETVYPIKADARLLFGHAHAAVMESESRHYARCAFQVKKQNALSFCNEQENKVDGDCDDASITAVG